MADIEKQRENLQLLRKKIFITGYRGGMAHFASCFSCIEMIYALYMENIVRYDPQNPKWEERDRFVLSKGHAGLALYSVLNMAGLVSDEVLASYLTDNSLIGGEPCMRDNPWIEATTGSLGHGLSMALGIAIALKIDGKKSKVYCMLGDGELQEGTLWEAIMTAPSFKTDNLIAIIDSNKIQKMDFVEKTIGEPDWKRKFEAFGWTADEVDGHDVEAFKKCALKENASDRPRVIIADTVKGKGVSLMEESCNWHFRMPKKKELKIFLDELGISEEELA